MYLYSSVNPWCYSPTSGMRETSPGSQGLGQVLGDQGNLIESQLLEQDIHVPEIRTGNIGGLLLKGSQQERIYAVNVGLMDPSKPHIIAQRNNY